MARNVHRLLCLLCLAIAPALASGADYSVAFSGAPACSLTITMLSQAASVGADERLIVTYEAALDSDSQQATPLVNVAGVIRASDPALQARLLSEENVVVRDGRVIRAPIGRFSSDDG